MRGLTDDGSMTITVYSKPECQQCRATHLALEKAQLPHTVVDVTVDSVAREYVRSLGYSGAPVVVADGQHWSGFRPDRIKALAPT